MACSMSEVVQHEQTEATDRTATSEKTRADHNAMAPDPLGTCLLHEDNRLSSKELH